MMQFRYMLIALIGAALPCVLWLDAGNSALLFAIVAARYFSVRSNPKPWPAWLRVGLTIALTAGIWFQFGTLFGRAPGGALLLSMLAMKSTESAKRRDARVLVTTCLFVIVASFLMNQSVPALILSVIGSIACFAALEVLSRPALGPTHSPFGSLGFSDAGWLLMLALPITVLLWLFVPRLGTPLWGTTQGNNGRTGLSDRMLPGSVAELLADDTPNMRIFFEGTPPNPNLLYFRGPVLWNLNELGEWTTNNAMRYTSGRPAPPQPSDIRYRVTLEPNDQRFLFVADQAISVSEGARFTFEQRFERFRPVNDLLTYTASSRLSTEIEVPNLPKMQTSAGLQLPLGNPRTRAMAAKWREETTDSRALVEKGLNFLRVENFRYNLAPADITSLERVDDFLFRTQEGYCEHYSGSFAFLMRAAGVPTRVVTGFAGGSFPVNADYLLVRNSDAHAWNEVYIDGKWIRVDPTSVLPRERIIGRPPRSPVDQGMFSAFSDLSDRMAEWWNRAVLGFNANRQMTLLSPLGVENADWRDLIRVLGVGILIVVLIGAGILYWRRPRDSEALAVKAYRSLLRKLTKQGLTSTANEPPSAVLQRAAKQFPQSGLALLRLAGEFERLQYSLENPTESATQAFVQTTRVVSKSLKAKG